MAKSTRKAPGKAGTPTTVDIPHEEVTTTTAPAAKQELRILSQDEMIELELRKLSPAEQKLNELYTKFEKLTITGPEDKEGYRLVKEAWRETLTFRTGVENTALAMRRDYTAINKAIASKEGQLVGRAKPLEEKLQKLWKAIDEEKERQEKEEEARLERQLEERLGKLTNAGAKYDDGYYVIGDTVTFDVATLRAMTEEKFEKLLKVVQDTALELKAQADRKEQEERQRRENEEREKREARQAIKETRGMLLDALGLVPEEEQQRLVWKDGDFVFYVPEASVYDVDQATFNQKVSEIKQQIARAGQEKKFKQEQEERRQRELARKNLEGARTLALEQAGLKLHLGIFQYQDGYNTNIQVPAEELFNLDEAHFQAAASDLSALVGKNRTALLEKQKEDQRKQEELKQRKTAIAEKMQELGFRYLYNRDAFEFTNKLYTVTFSSEYLLNISEADLDALYEQQTKKIAESIHQILQQEYEEREQLERERLAGLNDDEVWFEYLQNLRAVLRPKLEKYKSKKSHTRQAQFFQKLEALILDYTPAKKSQEVKA